MKTIVTLLFLIVFSFQTNANERFVEHRDWKTYETQNFRVHFTPEYEDWAISAANELERARELINRQQGRVVTKKIDAVVFDPFNASNGYAIPFANKPFTGLYATPPQSDSIISNSSSWQQLLVLHEYVHLVHLTQPERNDWRNQLGKLWDLYDIQSIDTPRWAIEGYATLLESKTSSRGRLFNNQVEAILTQFAREGALPTYEQLSQTQGRYLAGSMAYLVGARFLYWLETNYSEKKLDNVWPRLRAKKSRNFDEAFTGIFRQSAKHLYQRFVAEYTAQAIMSERVLENDNSQLWLDIKDSASAPAISPNGEQLVLVQQNSDGHTSLNVYSTAKNTKAKEKFKEQTKKLLENDPEDVPDSMPMAFNPERKYHIFQKNYMRIDNPRWLSNGSIVFNSSTRNKDGELHQDISMWDLDSGEVTLLSKAQNLRRFDILPEQNWLIAERNKFGKSQLVKFDLTTQQLTELTTATLDVVYDFPRINPIDNTQLAFVSSELNQNWQLHIINTENTKQITVPAPKGYQFLSYPTWSPDGQSLYYVAGLDNQLIVYRYHLENEQLDQVTQGQQVIAWPTIDDSQQMFMLATNSQGPDVYRLDLQKASIAQVKDITTSAQLSQTYNYEFQLALAKHDLNKDSNNIRDYGLGHQNVTASLGASFNSASYDLLEIGIRGGDVLQRLTYQLKASTSTNKSGLLGTSGSVRWQGWPLKVSAHLFDITLKPYNQRDPVITQEQSIYGGMFSLVYPLRYDTLTIDPFVRVVATQGDNEQTNFQLGWTQQWFLNYRIWGLFQSSELSLIDGEQSSYLGTSLLSDVSYDGHDISFTLGGEYQQYRLAATLRQNKRNNSDLSLISLGGYSSSLFNRNAHINRYFAPELSFDSAFSNDIRHYEFAAWYKDTPLRLFYGEYHVQDAKDINIFGVKGNVGLNTEILGASDLEFQYGLMQVDKELSKPEIEGYLGMSYQF